MRVIRSLMPGLLILGLAAILVACGSSEKAGEEPEAAGTQVPAAEVVKHMHDHLARVQDTQHAVVRGDLEGARTAARWIADHEELAGLPDKVQPTIDAMKKGARDVVDANDLEGAGDGTASMAAACGSCHSSMAARPAFPATASQAKPSNPTAAQMLEHERAVDMLYRGLVVPSDEMWKRGAEALKAAPLVADKFPQDAMLSREALNAQALTHEAAEKAAGAQTPTARAEVYGDLIGGCASCHAISGRVIGAGVPK